MVISFYGEDCFKIQSGDLTILTDPLDPEIGLTPTRFKYDALIKTISPFPPSAETDFDKQETLNIIGPGEYNFKGMNIYGYALENESTDKFLKTVYIINIEEIKLAFLGHISEIPSPSVMEHLEEIDILILPGGGEPFLEQKKAIKLIRQIQPKIAIPAFYKIPGLKRKTDDLKTFLNEFGKEKTETQEKLTVKKKDLNNIKPTQIVALKI